MRNLYASTYSHFVPGLCFVLPMSAANPPYPAKTLFMQAAC
ncbi:MAG: hypothetical protein PHO08_06310 [Methylococcales bacterium]|nr:hypothetical protein [Methylococcales bacterium]MDD5632542.1 hypothetical protein [Methylococcales bacterium]